MHAILSWRAKSHPFMIVRRYFSASSVSSISAEIQRLDKLIESKTDTSAKDISVCLNGILSRKNELESDIFVLLPILKRLKQSTDTWTLLKVIKDQIPSASMSQISSSCWNIAKISVPDPSLWRALLDRILSSNPLDYPVKFTSRALWGVCNSNVPLDHRDIGKLKAWLRMIPLPALSSQDLVMIIASLSQICPKDTPTIIEYTSLLKSSTALPTTAILSLWTSASRMSPPPPPFLELLSEQSRALRLDPVVFGDQGCARLAKAVIGTNCEDARVFYQLIFFVRSQSHKIRTAQLISLIKSFSKLNISDDVVWKRFAVRMEKLGPLMTGKDLNDIKRCFAKMNKLSTRTRGLIECYISIREEAERYGPS